MAQTLKIMLTAGLFALAFFIVHQEVQITHLRYILARMERQVEKEHRQVDYLSLLFTERSSPASLLSEARKYNLTFTHPQFFSPFQSHPSSLPSQHLAQESKPLSQQRRWLSSLHADRYVSHHDKGVDRRKSSKTKHLFSFQEER